MTILGIIIVGGLIGALGGSISELMRSHGVSPRLCDLVIYGSICAAMALTNDYARSLWGFFTIFLGFVGGALLSYCVKLVWAKYYKRS